MTILGQPTNPDLEAKSNAVEGTFNLADTIFIWIGRFGHRGGYGTATRTIYRALKEANLAVIGVDSQTCSPIDDSGHLLVDVEKANGSLIIKAKSRHQRIVAIFHEIPPHWGRLTASGKTHFVGYTVTETEQIPFGWIEHMLAVDSIWTATHFNRDIFANARVPRSMLNILPHAVDVEFFRPRKKRLDFPGTNSFRFLHIVSNLNRKDVGVLVRAYASAFSPTDDVSLLIKLPSNISDADIKKYIFDAAMPWVDLHSRNVPHVVLIPDFLTDEKLVELYASCHAYASLERGKGWDLPSLEAMLMGLPTLNLGWGANTEFQSAENSVQIPPLSRTVFSNEENVTNKELYYGHTWAGVDLVEAANAFKKLHDNYNKEVEKTLQARPELVSLVSFNNITTTIRKYVETLENHDFRSNSEACITIKGKDPEKARTEPRKILKYEDLPTDEKNILCEAFSEDGNAQDWAAKRRKIWGKHGAVLPDLNDRRKLASLRNNHLGSSIFILGNGPSLNKVNLSSLSEYHTFAVNKIYLLFDKIDWRPDFYTTLDWRVTPDNFEEVNRLDGMTFFFPHRFRGMLRDGADVFWYESTSPGRSLFDRFEINLEKGARGGGTVLTAAIQIAYFMGFRKIFLVGVDASYHIPSTVRQSGGDRFGTGTQINLESTKDDDTNHFDPRYFGKGTKWHDPNVDEMIRGFRACHRAIECSGGELINATSGGDLECMPRMTFDDALLYADKKNS